MNREVQLSYLKRIGVIAIVLIGIIAAVFGCSYKVVKELESQLYHNLEDVANQNALALRNQVQSNYILLKGMESRLEQMPESNEEAIQDFDSFVEQYGLKRIAYCSADGMTHSTDGVVMDLSYREFFKRGMEGKNTITEILEDAMDEKHGLVNVMSIPMYDDAGNVKGVFGMTYDSETFNSTLKIESFDGQGYSCILNEDGQIMVAMGNSELKLSHNFFTDVLSKDKRNKDSLAKLQESMAGQQSGGGILYLSTKNYYYCTPVSLMQDDITWYVFTLIPAKVLESRFAPIRLSLYLMSIVVVLCMMLGIILTVFFSRKQREEMRRLAYEDKLTGGANYDKFCLDMENRRSKEGYLISMDITNFNNMNIAAGKEAGDKLLCHVWNILNSSLSGEETAGRVRDDLFVLFLLSPDEETIIERMEKISDRMNKLARLSNVWGIHARYGIYGMDAADSVNEAFEKAEIAKAFVKKKKDVRHAFYHETDHKQRLMDQQLEARFEAALVKKEFEVWYQPKYKADTGEVVGSEALVRWRDKDGSMISPGRFIPILEENGAIARLDEYMFRAVCRQQEKWTSEGRKILPVSVNISRASLYYADIVEKYQKILQSYHVEPYCIQLEVTESAMAGKVRIYELLERFRKMGIYILMDDFGTGYSSLATLNMKCFDTLKLDKSLIDHIGEKDGETLLYHVINMGQQLGLHITAEGVETEMQLEYLKERKCDDIQGFFFARPMPAAEFEKLL